jgi:thiol-disulfide isomerase/thioredoxin
MSKTVNLGYMPSLNSVGGNFLSKIRSNTPSLFSWTTLAIFVFLIILAFVAYSMYNSYISSILKPTYKANSEQMQKNSNNGKEVELLLFSTDWCPHCKRAKPEWEQVKAEYEGKQVKGYTLVFTEVNCTNENPDVEKMMNTYKVEGFPTIKLIKESQVIDFDAKPTKDTLTQFINTVI